MLSSVESTHCIGLTILSSVDSIKMLYLVDNIWINNAVFICINNVIFNI